VGTPPAFRLLDSMAIEQDGRICVGTMIEGGITIFGTQGGSEFLPLPDVGITNIALEAPTCATPSSRPSTSGTPIRVRWPRSGLRGWHIRQHS
jgi:gluconolactonase